MKVHKIELSDSPMSAERVCVRAEVVYSSLAHSENYWFDFPRTHANELSLQGNPWLVCLLPLAVNLGESLEIESPVDETLLFNAYELISIWNCWYPQLRPVEIHAPTPGTSCLPQARRHAALFSAGVDAWFTLLRHAHGSVYPNVDDLLTIWGLDIPLGNPNGFDLMRSAQRRVANEFGIQAIDIATNLLETTWWVKSDWGRVSHGCALGCAGLFLEKRYQSLLIPSTHRYDDLEPWGSHPLTDPLLSTSSLRVIHDGAAFGRVEKIQLLIRHKTAMETLQVCWESKSFENCEKCAKCYCTMATLELLGALELCPRFRNIQIDPSTLTRIFTLDDDFQVFLHDLRKLATEKKRWDMVKAIDRSFKWNRRRHVVGSLRSYLKGPLTGRLQKPLSQLGKFMFQRLSSSSSFILLLLESLVSHV